MSVANAFPLTFVTCAKKVSGVELDVLCADPIAPAISIEAAAAHKNANMSLNIKTPMNNLLAHLGIERKYRNRILFARSESDIVMVRLKHRKHAIRAYQTAV
jgi:hypothetical protein